MTQPLTSAELAEKIRALETRQSELTKRRGNLQASIAAKREELGKAIAAGNVEGEKRLLEFRSRVASVTNESVSQSQRLEQFRRVRPLAEAAIAKAAEEEAEVARLLQERERQNAEDAAAHQRDLAAYESARKSWEFSAKYAREHGQPIPPEPVRPVSKQDRARLAGAEAVRSAF